GGGQKNLGAMTHREIRADYAPETLAAEVKNRLDQFGWIFRFNTSYTHRVYLHTSQIRFFSASPAVWAERLHFAPPRTLSIDHSLHPLSCLLRKRASDTIRKTASFAPEVERGGAVKRTTVYCLTLCLGTTRESRHIASP